MDNHGYIHDYPFILSMLCHKCTGIISYNIVLTMYTGNYNIILDSSYDSSILNGCLLSFLNNVC